MGEALTGLIRENPSLWVEYCSDTVPAQGAIPEGGVSAILASEMNAYARENHVSLAMALSELCKSNPYLLQGWREEIATIV